MFPHPSIPHRAVPSAHAVNMQMRFARMLCRNWKKFRKGILSPAIICCREPLPHPQKATSRAAQTICRPVCFYLFMNMACRTPARPSLESCLALARKYCIASDARFPLHSIFQKSSCKLSILKHRKAFHVSVCTVKCLEKCLSKIVTF